MTAKREPPAITTHRLEAFSDGVFAIVITLLILEIKVPHLPAGAPDLELLRELGHLWPKYLSFALSFVIIGIYWVGHHQMFHFIDRTDRPLLWLNNLFLLTVTLIPFPTALMGDYIHSPIAVIPYGLTLIVCNLSLRILWAYAVRARLVAPDLEPGAIKMVNRRVILPVYLYGIAILLSIVSAKLTLAVYALVPASYILPGKIDTYLSRRR